MSRLIDADALIECLQTWKTVAVSEGLPINERFATAMIAQVNLMPTIEERKTGKWIQFPNHMAYKCSECGRVIQTTDGQRNVSKHYPFCHCGADMRCEDDDIPIEYFESGGK